jgi:hypothetical protein
MANSWRKANVHCMITVSREDFCMLELSRAIQSPAFQALL